MCTGGCHVLAILTYLSILSVPVQGYTVEGVAFVCRYVVVCLILVGVGVSVKTAEDPTPISTEAL